MSILFQKKSVAPFLECTSATGGGGVNTFSTITRSFSRTNTHRWKELPIFLKTRRSSIFLTGRVDGRRGHYFLITSSNFNSRNDFKEKRRCPYLKKHSSISRLNGPHRRKAESFVSKTNSSSRNDLSHGRRGQFFFENRNSRTEGGANIFNMNTPLSLKISLSNKRYSQWFLTIRANAITRMDLIDRRGSNFFLTTRPSLISGTDLSDGSRSQYVLTTVIASFPERTSATETVS